MPLRPLERRLLLYCPASRCANGAFLGWGASTAARCIQVYLISAKVLLNKARDVLDALDADQSLDRFVWMKFHNHF